MQNAVSEGEGGMLAILGSQIKTIEKILDNNKDKFNVQIANDNSEGQIVLKWKKQRFNRVDRYFKIKKNKKYQTPSECTFSL